MNDAVEKLCDFKYKVAELLNDKKAHKHFRYRTLLLINEYFNFDRMLFTIYEEDLEVNCWKNSLDTISFGVDFYAINEYYNNFYNLDPMQKIKSEKHVLLLSEIEGDNFVESHYYKNFLEKYNVRYEVDANIFKENKKIAQIVYLRSNGEGDFDKQDIFIIEEINKIVTTELLKAINFKKIYMELSVLNELRDSFPIGKIVLDEKYNINYYNTIAEKHINELTGSDVGFFKYYFMNSILRENGIIDYNEEITIEIKGFWLKIIPFNEIVLNEKISDKYIIYIVKNNLFEDRKIKLAYNDTLTQREQEVAKLIKLGYSNKEISTALEISTSTVKSHVQSLFDKTKTKSRIQLINTLYFDK